MARYLLCASLLSLLLCTREVSSFGPSVPGFNEVTSSKAFVDQQIEVDEDVETDVLSASLGMDDTMIVEEYCKWIDPGAKKQSDKSLYPQFKKTFLANIKKTIPTTSKWQERTSETDKLAASLGIDETVVRQEYNKWLTRYDKTADPSRYDQFKTNFLRQFQVDLQHGKFFMLNENGDCTEAEATTKLLDIQELQNISKEEMEKRKWEAHMFTPAVRRDIYRILRNPLDVKAGLLGDSEKDGLFSVSLLTKTSNENSFAFVNKKDIVGKKLDDYIVLEDMEIMQAIENIGMTTTKGLAITQAFEAFLAKAVHSFGDSEALSLSVDFLVAFGNEMTERLDIHNRIRSGRLSEEEMTILSKEPFSSCIDREALEMFQQGSYRRADQPMRNCVARRKRPAPPTDIVGVTVKTNFDVEEMVAREQDVGMYTAAVRRGIYSIMRNPNNLQFGASSTCEDSVFGVAILVKKSGGLGWDTFAFADRHAFQEMDPDGYKALGDDEIIKAIGSIGMINPVSLALTGAFEAYLSQLSKSWGDGEVSSLSVEFLVAFGRELGPRLDVNNRLRTKKLTEEEMLILSSHPFASCVGLQAMRQYQSCPM